LKSRMGYGSTLPVGHILLLVAALFLLSAAFCDAQSTFDFEIVVEPEVRLIAPGDSTSFLIHLPLKAGTPRTLFVECTQLFSEGSISFDPQYVVAGGYVVATLWTSTSVPEGTYVVVFKASGGGKAYSTPVQVVVSERERLLEIRVSPESGTVQTGGSANFSVEVVSEGLPGEVELETLNLPPGVEAYLLPEKLSPPGRSILQIAALPYAQTGSHIITVSASVLGLTDFQAIRLAVVPPQDGTASLGRFVGTLDAYWEYELLQENASKAGLLPERRWGRFTVDLSLDLAGFDRPGEVIVSGRAVMRLESPSRQILLDWYMAGMSVDPTVFSGQVVGQLSVQRGELELEWVDKPPVATTYLWERYDWSEPNEHTESEAWGETLLDALCPISVSFEAGGQALSLHCEHRRSWELNASGGGLGSSLHRASGSLYVSWMRLSQGAGEAEVSRGGRILNYTSMILGEGDTISCLSIGPKIEARAFDLLMDGGTTLELAWSSAPERTGWDIVEVARKEVQHNLWKYSQSRAMRLPWVLDQWGNELPIHWGIGRPKGDVFVAAVLYKAGFFAPMHNLFDDGRRPGTSDPARAIEVYDTSRYRDILPVVKQRYVSPSYGDLRIGDIVVTPNQTMIITAVYTDAVNVTYYSNTLDRVVDEKIALPPSVVVRRPTPRPPFCSPHDYLLAPYLHQGRLRLYNCSYEPKRQGFAYIYCPEEFQLYAEEERLFWGEVDLDQLRSALVWSSVCLQGIPTHVEQIPVKIVQTPLSVIEIQRSDVSVEMTPDGSTVVEVLSGMAKVTAASIGVSTYVYPGERAIVTSTNLRLESPPWTGLSRWWGQGGQGARLHVVPSPTDAQVRVDGVGTGRGTLSLGLESGSHMVEALREGYRPWSDVVNVGTGGSLVVLPSLTPEDGFWGQANYTILRDGQRLRARIYGSCLIQRFVYSNRTRSIWLLWSGWGGKPAQVRLAIPEGLIGGPLLVSIDGEEVRPTSVGVFGSLQIVILNLDPTLGRLVSLYSSVSERSGGFVFSTLFLVLACRRTLRAA